MKIRKFNEDFDSDMESKVDVKVMKHLKLYEGFVNDCGKQIKAIKDDAHAKLTYLCTTLMEEFGFEIRPTFSFTNKVVTNLYRINDNRFEITTELVEELLRLKRRLGSLGLTLGVGHDAVPIKNRVVANVSSDEDIRELLNIDKKIQMWIFIFDIDKVNKLKGK